MGIPNLEQVDVDLPPSLNSGGQAERIALSVNSEQAVTFHLRELRGLLLNSQKVGTARRAVCGALGEHALPGGRQLSRFLFRSPSSMGWARPLQTNPELLEVFQIL